MERLPGPFREEPCSRKRGHRETTPERDLAARDYRSISCIRPCAKPASMPASFFHPADETLAPITKELRCARKIAVNNFARIHRLSEIGWSKTPATPWVANTEKAGVNSVSSIQPTTSMP
jgi:hypothetical protein